MPQFHNYSEWEPVKGPLLTGERDGSPRDNNIDALFDAVIRRRFGELISQAAINSNINRTKAGNMTRNKI